jgi:hypothetical protein
MKKTLLAILLLAVLMSACLATTFEYYPMNIKVAGLLKEPTSESEAAFIFPIDVSLTGISKDKQWYRFKVFYNLVFFGKYEFEGWCHINPWEPFMTNATPEVIELK